MNCAVQLITFLIENRSQLSNIQFRNYKIYHKTKFNPKSLKILLTLLCYHHHEVLSNSIKM